jgi:hypothetical protein
MPHALSARTILVSIATIIGIIAAHFFANWLGWHIVPHLMQATGGSGLLWYELNGDFALALAAASFRKWAAMIGFAMWFYLLLDGLGALGA